MILWAIRLSVVAGLAVYVFGVLPTRQLVESLTSIAPAHVLSAWLLLLCGHYIGAWLQKALFDRQGLSLSASLIFRINLGVHFYGLFVPGGVLTSSALRWYRLAGRTGRPVEIAAASILNRVIEVLTCSALAFFGWLIAGRTGGAAVGLVLGLLLAAMVSTYCCLSSRTVAAGAARRLRRLSRSRPRWRRLGLKLVASFRRASASPWRLHLTLISLSVGRVLVWALALYFLATGLSLGLSLVAVVWVHSATAVLTLLPISIGGLGVREASYVALLRSYDVAAVMAVSLGLLQFAISILNGVVGGLIELIDVLSGGRMASGVRTATAMSTGLHRLPPDDFEERQRAGTRSVT